MQPRVRNCSQLVAKGLATSALPAHALCTMAKVAQACMFFAGQAVFSIVRRAWSDTIPFKAGEATNTFFEDPTPCGQSQCFYFFISTARLVFTIPTIDTSQSWAMIPLAISLVSVTDSVIFNKHDWDRLILGMDKKRNSHTDSDEWASWRGI